MTNDKKMPLFGHLLELRTRLIRSVLVLAVTIVVSFIFYPWIYNVLLFPAQGSNLNLIYTDLTEMIGTTMKVAITSGFIIAMPYLSYEVIMFVSPALTDREKRYVYLALPWITIMFLGGVAFCYFLMLPPMLHFLLTFGQGIAEPQIKIGSYIAVVTRLLLAVGLVFEFPVVTTFLARIGVLNPGVLSRFRKPAIIGAFILAAIITPTVDPVNQTIVTAPLIILYEMSIWLAKLVYRRRKQTFTPVT